MIATTFLTAFGSAKAQAIPPGVTRLVERAFRSVHRPSALVLVLTGHSAAVVAHLSRAELPAPVLVLESTGLLTQEGELEGHGAAGLVLAGAEITTSISSDACAVTGPAGCFTATFLSREIAVEDAVSAVPGDTQVGGGVEVLYRVAAGRAEEGRVGLLRFPRGVSPWARHVSSCRTVSPPFLVTRSAPGWVYEFDGDSAISKMTEHVGGGKQSGLLLLSEEDEAFDSPTIRALRGADLERGALAIIGHAPKGTKVAFAVRNAGFAKERLEAEIEAAKANARGAKLDLALYLTSALRGASLHGTSDVDLRILKKRLPSVPLFGFQTHYAVHRSSAGVLRVQTSEATVALFRSPS